MKKNSLSLVIVGHVDHGKSTLIGRLLFDTDSVPEELVEEVRAISEELGKEMEFAYFLDALEEEREQNITIDTTQTFFSTASREYVIIDAPGHKEFLKNMITGVSQAEAAVLMVDVEQGMEEQTRRHAYILGLLGVKQVLVAANKMDVVEYDESRFTDTERSVREFLSKLGIEASHVIPVSGKTGENIANPSENMPWYKGGTLIEILNDLETAEVLLDRPLRFPVQDIYEIEGSPVAVGRVESGRIRAGDELSVLPGGSSTEVKQIEVWKAERSEAGAGESIGLRLRSLDGITRGAVLCATESAPNAVNEFDATVFWMSSESYKRGESVQLRCATQEVEVKIDRIRSRVDSSTLEVLAEDADSLEETEAGKVVISCSQPIVVEDFGELEELGRFVLVRSDEIVGGGIVHR